MAYRSKEKYPLKNNPKTMTYCHIDPARHYPCQIHFHPKTEKEYKKIVSIQPPADDYNALEMYEWGLNDSLIGGYHMFVLMSDFDFTVEDVRECQSFPPIKDRPPLTSPENEAWLLMKDNYYKSTLDPDVQVAIISDRLKAIDPELNEAIKLMDTERTNPNYPANKDPYGNGQKSSRYYELAGKIHDMFEERARLMVAAGYQLGLDKSENEDVRKLMSITGFSASTVERDINGNYRNYWSRGAASLRDRIESRAKREDVQANYSRTKEMYAGVAKTVNDSIRTHGTDFRGPQVKPSENLQRVRVEAKILEKAFAKAEAELEKANVFNKNSKKDKVSQLRGELMRVKGRLESAERQG